MTPQEFGRIAAIIRDEVLNLSQGELAEKLGASQSAVSRMERGFGTIEYLFALLTFFQSQGIRVPIIFAEPFDKTFLLEQSSMNVDQIMETVKEIKGETAGRLDHVLMLLNTLS